MANLPEFEIVESVAEALKNARKFQQVNTSCGGAFDSLGRYYHWYYFPNQKIFAPSKFIGYKNMTFEIYDEYHTKRRADGETKVLDGRDTQEALYESGLFRKLKRDSGKFDYFAEKLETFVRGFDKSVSKRTYRNGGIYVPNYR